MLARGARPRCSGIAAAGQICPLAQQPRTASSRAHGGLDRRYDLYGPAAAVAGIAPRLISTIRGVTSPATAATPLLSTAPTLRRGSFRPAVWRSFFAQMQPDVALWNVAQVRLWAEDVLRAARLDPKHGELFVREQINGRALLQLNRAQLQAHGLPCGPAVALANAIATLAALRASDPFLVLESLDKTQEWKKLRVPAPATAPASPFQDERGAPQGRWMVVDYLWEHVVLPNWKSFRAHRRDKKAWLSVFVHGSSGVGKTRFSLEFLGLLRAYLSQQRFDRDKEVLELRERLKDAHVVLLDIRHGSALAANETVWPPTTILGLRLAAKYWFPQVPYSDIRTAFSLAVDKDPRLFDRLSLHSVLEAISRRPPAARPENPSPRIPRVLHIAVDEIQTASDLHVTNQPIKEPLSLALNRALLQSVSGTPELFVFGTFAGTARRHPKEHFDPIEYQSVDVLLHPLVPDAVAKIVASFKRRDDLGQWTGAQWLALGEPFDRLLRAIGGNPRALECLQSVLLAYHTVPASLPLDNIVTRLAPVLAEMFSLASWGQHGSGSFGLLLALAGIPVTRDTVIPGPSGAAVATVRDLEKAGLLQLRPPPVLFRHPDDGDPVPRPPVWASTWDVTAGTVVLEIPLLMALAALECPGVSDSPVLGGLEAPAKDLLRQLYHSTTTFEQALVRHGVFRHSVASRWASLHGRSSVPAKDLFCGSVCSTKFAAREFELSNAVELIHTPRRDVWCKDAGAAAAVLPRIELQDGSILSLSRARPFGLHLGGGDVMDGVQGARLAGDERPVLIWLDTKHGQWGTEDSLNPQEVRAVLDQLKALERKLPEFVHLLRAAATKPMSSAVEIAKDEPRVCFLSNTDDGLAWSLSPTLAYLLTSRTASL